MTNTSVSQMIITCIVLPVNTLEGNWVEKKRQHSPWNINLSVKDILSLSVQPASFSCSPEFFNQKCAEFSSELNGAIGRFL